MRKFSKGKIQGFLWLAGIVFSSITAVAQPLSGNYTIDAALPSGTTNFTSFTEAVTALSTNGITAPVVFTASSGVYTEQLIIPQITGSSAVNTITFTGNGTNISFASANGNERAVIKLNGADHIILDRLLIMATGTTNAEYGYGIQLINDADSNVITNCTIVSSESTTMNVAANYAGIVVNSVANAVITAGNANCDGNVIKDNTITGGYYGIALVADGANGVMIHGNVVRDNVVQDFYNVGIYLNGNNAAIIERNDISRPDRPFSPVYQFMGISLSAANTNLKVNANKIHDPFGANTTGSSGAFGIYMYNCSATAGNENMFSNNLCYNFLSTGIASGIDLSGSSYNKFVHNTISLDDVPSTAVAATRGININSSGNLTILNNNVTVSRGGTWGSKHCIYLGGNSNGNTIDQNNFLMSADDGGVKAVGYYSGNRISLQDWQNASGYDAQSFSIDPMYANPSSGDFLPSNGLLQAGAAIAVSGIATDIQNLQRSQPSSGTLPTIGAFEIGGTPLPVNWSPLEARLVSGKTVLDWQTFTEHNNAGFDIEKSNDGKNWSSLAFISSKGINGNSRYEVAYTFTDNYPVAGTVYYRIKQKDLDGTSVYSNVAMVSVKGSSAALGEVWPNPATDKVYVRGVAPGAVFQLLNYAGRVLLEMTSGQGVSSISLSGLPAGIYLLHATSADGEMTWKLIKTN